MKLKLVVIISLFLCVGCLRGFAQNPKPAVSSCRVGVEAAAFGYFRWAPNSRVRVYLRTNDFKATEIAYVLAPLRSWNAASTLTHSGVTLRYVGETDKEQLCENCLTIIRGALATEVGHQSGANLRVYTHNDNNQIMVQGTLIIEPSLTNLTELTDVVAHQLGHSFGLFDCHTCKSKSTVMNQFTGLHVSNELPAPTACDIAQVTAGYRQLSTTLLMAALGRKPTVIEEGEEPFEDNMTIVLGGPK